MSRFLSNSELTKDMKINLSHRLRVTEAQVVHFFHTQSKKPRNASIEAYSKLLQCKGLKYMTNLGMRTFNLYINIAYMLFALELRISNLILKANRWRLSRFKA